MTHQPLYERLEDAVLVAVRRGRWLAEDWADQGPEPVSSDRARISETLARIEAGEVTAARDDYAVQCMGKALRTALNELKPGYGDLALRIDTSDHLVFDMPREQLRQLMERWKSFRDARQEVRDLAAAIRAYGSETRANR